MAVSELSKGCVPESFMYVKIYISWIWPHPGTYHTSSIMCTFFTVSVYVFMWPVGAQRAPTGHQKLYESDSTVCCIYTVYSSWRWAFKARNV